MAVGSHDHSLLVCPVWLGITDHTAMSVNFQVIVGNVGTVYDGPDREEAVNTYKYYVDYSEESPASRCGGEDVVLFNGAWLEREHIGSNDS